MLIKLISLVLSMLMGLLSIAPTIQIEDRTLDNEEVVIADKVESSDDAVQKSEDVEDYKIKPESEKLADYTILEIYYLKYQACLKQKDIYTEESFKKLENVVNSIDWDVTISDSEAGDEYLLGQILVDAMAVRLNDAINKLEYEAFTITFHANNGSDMSDITIYVPYGEDTSKFIPQSPVNKGYVLSGWYDDDGTFEHLHNFGKMKGNCDVYAKWELDHSANDVSLIIIGGVAYLRVNGKPEEFGGALIKKEYPIGTRISVKAAPNSDGTFLYWYDQNNRIVSTDEEYDFIVKTNINLNAQYVAKTVTYCRVIFVDRDNRIIGSEYVKRGEAVSAPSVRSNYHTGYVFDHWDKDLSCVTDSMIVKAVYCSEDLQYSVAVSGGIIENASDSGLYAYDELVTIKADDSIDDSLYFVGWSDDGGETIISDKEEYSFRVCRDTQLEAVYDIEPTEDTAIITIKGEVLNDGKIRFMTERSLPVGYRLLESGILVTKDSVTVDGDKFNLEMLPSHSDIRIGKTIDRSPDGQYAVVISPTQGNDYYAIGYIVYSDNMSCVHTDYSEIVQVFVQ